MKRSLVKSIIGDTMYKINVKKLLPLSLPLFTAFLASSALAAGNIAVEPLTVVEGRASAEILIGTEVWRGDNTYQIGNPVHWFDGTVDTGYFPFSELKFPADTIVASISTNVVFRDNWLVSASLKKNITEPHDDMIDKDWITDSNPNQLDIYSNSTMSDFEMVEIDINGRYRFLQGNNWSLNGGLGFLFQHWNYEAALINQYSPSGMDGYDFTGDGSRGISYKLEYQIPYMQVGGQVQFNDIFSMQGSFSYSPWVTAENTDHHLLRGKTNKGELEGDAFMLNLEGRAQLSRHWFMTASFDYQYMKTDGRMDATFEDYYLYIYGVIPNHSVYEEIESNIYNFALNVGYLF